MIPGLPLVSSQKLVPGMNTLKRMPTALHASLAAWICPIRLVLESLDPMIKIALQVCIVTLDGVAYSGSDEAVGAVVFVIVIV